MIASSTFTCSDRLLLVSLPVVGPRTVRAQVTGILISFPTTTTAGGFAVTLPSQADGIALFASARSGTPFGQPVLVTVPAGQTQATFLVRFDSRAHGRAATARRRSAGVGEHQD